MEASQVGASGGDPAVAKHFKLLNLCADWLSTYELDPFYSCSVCFTFTANYSPKMTV